MRQIDLESLFTQPVDDDRIQAVHTRLLRKFETKVRGLRDARTYQF